MTIQNFSLKEVSENHTAKSLWIIYKQKGMKNSLI